MLAKCDRTNFSRKGRFGLDNDIDLFYLEKWSQFALLIILHPVLCMTGIVNNLLVILIIKNKERRRDFVDKMYVFIVLNAGCNIVYCVLMACELLNECISFNSPVYCSALYQTSAVQYFKIVFVHFLGNALRLCINITYISFTFSRYILATSKDSSIHRKIESLSIRAYVIVVFMCSIALSLFKLFQYTPNTIHIPTKEFPYEVYDEAICSKNNGHSCKLLNTFNLINVFFNDILFFVLNVIIDFLLFTHFKRVIQNKKDLTVFSTAHYDELKKKQEHMNKMVMFNCGLFFVSHFPEFLVSLLRVIFSKRIAKFCLFKFSCDLLNENARVFNILSINLQFFIYLFFNTKFADSYDNLKSKLFQLKNKLC